MEKEVVEQIASWILEADVFVINTGAGMGVDSGLPDYRGAVGGQWGKIEAQEGKSIFEIVNPKNFIENPDFAWKFFLERMKMYEKTTPHKGFSILMDWTKKHFSDYFILTSNIDNQFEKAGFKPEKIRELHGSIFHLQSERPKEYKQIWKNEIPTEELEKQVEAGNYPTCPDSAIPARPNVYMFRDETYINTRSKAQDKYFQEFLKQNIGKKFLVLEIGSGPHVQSIRVKTRMLRKEYEARVVRINPKDFKIKEPNIGLSATALSALSAIDNQLENHSK
jgi:NAD-dependent SIR2 family protein deacetylase